MSEGRLLDVLGSVGGLRRGVTTGTCAQAAAKGAAELLLFGHPADRVTVTLPRGQRLAVPIEASQIVESDGGRFARCVVKKDAGDDDDVTHGARIACDVTLTDRPGVVIRGGPGVGTVTRPGLPVPVGEAAINPVPRRMIRRELEALAPSGRGFTVTVSVENGERLARKTWNPRVGVVGGISIIGTSGIVEPKSSAACKSSIAMAIKVLAAGPERPLFLTPGYLGERVLKERYGIREERIVRAGDHLGFALKHAAVQLAKLDAPREVALIGHIGKLAKVAAGLFNTHSKYGDARLETLAAFAAAAGADPATVREILALDLAEAAIPIIRDRGYGEAFSLLAQRVHRRCLKRIGIAISLTVVLLSLEDEVLGSYPVELAEPGRRG